MPDVEARGLIVPVIEVTTSESGILMRVDCDANPEFWCTVFFDWDELGRYSEQQMRNDELLKALTLAMRDVNGKPDPLPDVTQLPDVPFDIPPIPEVPPLDSKK